MTGFMKTRPNIDGALFFVREILPASAPLVRRWSSPGRRRPARGSPAVGERPRHRHRRGARCPSYVRRAAVFVVPLRMGGGTRLKVLEGLSMLKPMVSTSLGCEGIDVEDGRDLLDRGRTGRLRRGGVASDSTIRHWVASLPSGASNASWLNTAGRASSTVRQRSTNSCWSAAVRGAERVRPRSTAASRSTIRAAA